MEVRWNDPRIFATGPLSCEDQSFALVCLQYLPFINLKCPSLVVCAFARWKIAGEFGVWVDLEGEAMTVTASLK